MVLRGDTTRGDRLLDFFGIYSVLTGKYRQSHNAFDAKRIGVLDRQNLTLSEGQD